MVNCPVCGTAVPEGAEECPMCLTSVGEQEVTCSECQKVLPAESLYCPDCEMSMVTAKREIWVSEEVEEEDEEDMEARKESIISDFMTIPGVEQDSANKLYDLGFRSLTDLVASTLDKTGMGSEFDNVLVISRIMADSLLDKPSKEMSKGKKEFIECPFCDTPIDTTHELCTVCGASLKDEIIGIDPIDLKEKVSDYVDDVMGALKADQEYQELPDDIKNEVMALMEDDTGLDEDGLEPSATARGVASEDDIQVTKGMKNDSHKGTRKVAKGAPKKRMKKKPSPAKAQDAETPLDEEQPTGAPLDKEQKAKTTSKKADKVADGVADEVANEPAAKKRSKATKGKQSSKVVKVTIDDPGKLQAMFEKRLEDWRSKDIDVSELEVLLENKEYGKFKSRSIEILKAAYASKKENVAKAGAKKGRKPSGKGRARKETPTESDKSEK